MSLFSSRPLASRSRLAVRYLLVTLALASPCAWADSVDVSVTGIEGELQKNVRKFLSIAAEHSSEWKPSYISRLHRRARGEIQSALQPFGYYQPVITATLDSEGTQWTAQYSIDKGPPTHIEELELQVRGNGAQVPGVRTAVEASKLEQGERLVHSRYTGTKTAMIQAAYDAGYLDAAFETSEIRVTPEANRAEVRLLMDTGSRYFFGPVSIDQDILKPEFVQRYVPFEPGAPFDTAKLNKLQLALTDTGYFSQIEIEANRDDIVDKLRSKREHPNAEQSADLASEANAPSQPHLPVTVRTQPSKAQKYTASAGFGTDTGPRVGLGVELRRINRSGHKFRADLQLSQLKQALSSQYIIPIDNVATDRLTFGATAKSEEFGDAISNSFALTASREDGWAWGRRRAYLNLERENFEFDEADTSTTSDLFYPGLTLSFERADNALFTRRGVSLSADIHGGTEAVISATDFIQIKLDGSAVFPLAERARLLLRGEFGATEVDNFSVLPPSQRFFTGGDRSVRGYGYETISPQNPEGDDIGGQYLAVASVEADYLFYKDYGAAIFFDMGDAANSTSFDLKRGVGIGLRWASPVGMIRLDFAHPLDDPDNSFHFHFSLGPDL